MNLEDHVGDIIRKARIMANVPADKIATAAGLSLTELQLLESSGASTKTANLAAVAPLVGLHPSKLERIASGWLPKVPDLSQWRELRRISTDADGMEVHCYMVWDEVTRDAALFDTGMDAEPIFKILHDNGLQLQHIFITHSHYDHIATLPQLRAKFPQAQLHTSERDAEPQHRNRPADFTHLGSLRITHRETPGHAEDGTTYVVGTWPDDAPNVVFVGDALFAGSIGKAPGAGELAKNKIREQIFSLPSPALLCPGHGPFTTVEQEKLNNPFF